MNYTNAIIDRRFFVGEMSASDAVIIFLRAPIRGRVKTRLARTLGEGKATEFYQLCVDATIDEIGSLTQTAEKHIFYADPEPEYRVKRYVGRGFKISFQEGKDLGERLYNSFRSVLGGGMKKAVIVATDVPDLTADVIVKAMDSLDSSDLVIGPSQDGGYYLIGMSALHPELFQGIDWGSDMVCQQTLEASQINGLKVKLLPRLIDIDTREDLIRWSRDARHNKAALMDFVKAVHL